MINMSALTGGGETCAMSPSSFQEDGTRLLAALEDQIGNAGCPSLAYNLLIARQALESHLSYKRWIAAQGTPAQSESATPRNREEVRRQEEQSVRSHTLLRRAHAAMMF